MTSTSKGWLRFIAVFAVLTLILVACGDGAEETTTTAGSGETTTTADSGTGDTTTTEAPMATGGVFSTYIQEPQQGLVPINTNESEGIAVHKALFKGLVDYDPVTTEIRNQVAESIVTDDGGKTWTVTLKPGWTFHNGEAVTSSSFVDAWNYAAYAPNAMQNAGFFAEIVGFEETSAETPTAETMSGLTVVDDLTFTIELTNANPILPVKLMYPGYFPIPSAFYDDPAAFGEAPIGNGPFMMDGVWEHDIGINVKAYPDYAGDDPALVDGIEFRIYADENTAYNDLLAGNLDVQDSLPPEQVIAAQAEFGDHYGATARTSFNYLVFPTYLPAFESADLKAALSMAIDREAITEAIFSGTRQPADSIIPPVFDGYREGACANWQYDPDAAKALFDQAGGWEGDMTIWFNSGSGHEDWVEAVTNQWSNVLGIPTESFKFESLQFSDYLDLREAYEITGPYRAGWGMDYPFAQNFLEPLFASWQTPDKGGANDAGFANDEFDQLVREGNAAAAESLDAALAKYQEAEDVLCREMVAIPMFWSQNIFASSDRVSGVYVDAFGDINYTGITVVSP